MGMMGTFYTVADNATSLAYSVHYYERYMIAVPQTRVIAVDGVSPSYETIRTKKYPLIAPVYAVTIKGVPADSPAAKLRDWLLSEDGQRTIRKSGLVPIDEKIAAE